MTEWPKQLPVLTDEQKRIKDEFIKYWHNVSPKKYGFYERFNHRYPVENCRQGGRVLDIGAGLGEQIAYENLVDTEYVALELRPEMAQVIKHRFPQVRVIIGDCQKPMDFPGKYFDRIQAIQVLEHLPNLPLTIREVHRILKSDGEFCVLIPCEGGLVHSLARNISAKRIFEKQYGTSYEWYIKTEHINKPQEIIDELNIHFKICKKVFYPLKIPYINLNLVIGMVLKPRYNNHDAE